MVGVDIYRVEDGRIAEHWDVVREEVSPTASGHPMFTVPGQGWHRLSDTGARPRQAWPSAGVCARREGAPGLPLRTGPPRPVTCAPPR